LGKYFKDKAISLAFTCAFAGGEAVNEAMMLAKQGF
jgi:hypothetical protein